MNRRDPFAPKPSIYRDPFAPRPIVFTEREFAIAKWADKLLGGVAGGPGAADRIRARFIAHGAVSAEKVGGMVWAIESRSAAFRITITHARDGGFRIHKVVEEPVG